MLNVNVNKIQNESKISTFPCIGSTKNDDLIVLFHENEKGIVLYSSVLSLNYKIGEYNTDWNMNEFHLYSGIIELSNQK